MVCHKHLTAVVNICVYSVITFVELLYQVFIKLHELFTECQTKGVVFLVMHQFILVICRWEKGEWMGIVGLAPPSDSFGWHSHMGSWRSQIYAVTCAHFCLRRPYGLIKVAYSNGGKVYSIGTGGFFFN